MAKRDYPFSDADIIKNFSSGICTQVDWEPRCNIIESDHILFIEVELPGVNKEDVSIMLQGGNELIIRGFKRQPRLESQHVAYHLFEREFGNFYKKILADFPLDAARISSKMENGVLTIQLPREATPKISVNIK